jgi:VanZ like family
LIIILELQSLWLIATVNQGTYCVTMRRPPWCGLRTGNVRDLNNGAGMLPWLVGFVGTALAVALIGTLLGVVALRLMGRPPQAAGVVLAGLTLFFLALTQLPFPDPDAMVCPVPYTAPRLTPFRFLFRGIELLAAPQDLPVRLFDRGVLSALMNLVLCAAIGAALARWTARGVGFAILWGATLSISVELTQLTAFWGMFPCPWRLFDVDDLILNVSGVMIGFAISSWQMPGRAG